MKFLFASDSFKGTLSSEQIIRLLTDSANRIFPGCETLGVPIADGGEGTVDAVIAVTKGEIKSVPVHGPLMENREASYGIFHGDSAIIEMAAASGLPMVPNEKRNPLYTTTYGTGELIKMLWMQVIPIFPSQLVAALPMMEAWEPCGHWESVFWMRREMIWQGQERIWKRLETLICQGFTQLWRKPGLL